MKKGIFYNLIARLFFITGSYILHISLARLLGSYYYGIFGVVLSILMICDSFLNNGIRQAVSRLAAFKPESALKILKKGLTYQCSVGLIISLILILLNSTLIRFFNDPELKIPLFIVSGLVVTQSIYFVIAGTLNGLHRFFSESILLSSYAIGRALMAIIIVYLGFKTSGAIAGLLLASLLSITIGGFLCRDCGKAPINFCEKELFNVAWPTMLTFGFINIIMNIDILALKHFIGYDKNIPGFYAAASAMSKPVYFILYAFGSVGMPIVASKFNKGEAHEVNHTVHDLFSFMFCLVTPGIVILMAIGGQLINIFFKIEYLPAVKPFGFLVIGFFFLGLSTIFAHCLIAVKKEESLVLIALGIGIFCLLLNGFLVPRYQMIGAAISTTCSSFLMSLILGITLTCFIGIFINLSSILKWASILGIIWVIANYIKGSLTLIFIYSFLLYFSGLMTFILTKEIEIKSLGSIFQKPKHL